MTTTIDGKAASPVRPRYSVKRRYRLNRLFHRSRCRAGRDRRQRVHRQRPSRSARSGRSSQDQGISVHFTARHIAIAAGLLAAAGIAARLLIPAPVPVETTAVTKGRFVATVDEDGKTRVRERYVIAAPLAGRLSRVWRCRARPRRWRPGCWKQRPTSPRPPWTAPPAPSTRTATTRSASPPRPSARCPLP